jgi:uncharacterized oligopeptide transporter (OPT) family protein
MQNPGILGIRFVTMLRRVLVEDAELPFPESIAASEIHKSGQAGVQNSRYLFCGMGVGAFFNTLVEFKFLAAGRAVYFVVKKRGEPRQRLLFCCRRGAAGTGQVFLAHLFDVELSRRRDHLAQHLFEVE